MATSVENGPSIRHSERYWLESRQPLASLALIVPLLGAYEIGVVFFGGQNGADAALRWVLERLGLGQHLLPPMLVVCALLGWHYITRQPWRLSPGVVPLMAVESLMLGLCLRVVAYVQGSLIGVSIRGLIADGVGCLGAGIYEEFIFRLILLSLLAWVFRRAGARPRMAMVAAVALGSLLFAAAHYVGPYGDRLYLSSFVFRALAGVFFSLVYIFRGFGIAAGSHAAYDVLVQLAS